MPPEAILKTIADNPQLLQALKEIISKPFYVEEIKSDMSNEQIGQLTRSRIDGLRKVEEGFREIEKYKTLQTEVTMLNPAR